MDFRKWRGFGRAHPSDASGGAKIVPDESGPAARRATALADELPAPSRILEEVDAPQSHAKAGTLAPLALPPDLVHPPETRIFRDDDRVVVHEGVVAGWGNLLGPR